MATGFLKGDPTECISCDSVLLDSNQALYPTEFLNSLSVSGLPPHKLILKIGQPIVMLRNLNPNAGLCNGTRLLVKNIYSILIEAYISIGKLKIFLKFSIIRFYY